MNTFTWDNVVDSRWNYFAIDSDGCGVLYENEPAVGVIEWWSNGGACVFYDNFSSNNWKESLVTRPEVSTDVIEPNNFSWDNIVVQYKYFAIDYNGEGYIYTHKPSVHKDKIWCPPDDDIEWDVEYMGTYSSSNNWEHSLVTRPETSIEFEEITINGKKYRLVPTED